MEWSGDCGKCDITSVTLDKPVKSGFSCRILHGSVVVVTAEKRAKYSLRPIVETSHTDNIDEVPRRWHDHTVPKQVNGGLRALAYAVKRLLLAEPQKPVRSLYVVDVVDGFAHKAE